MSDNRDKPRFWKLGGKKALLYIGDMGNQRIGKCLTVRLGRLTFEARWWA